MKGIADLYLYREMRVAPFVNVKAVVIQDFEA